MATTTNFTKDPNATLDYAFDWSSWLASGETITAQTVTVTKGDVTVSSGPTQASGKVTVWLTGGTAGVTSWVTCHITTNQGRQDDRTISLTVKER